MRCALLLLVIWMLASGCSKPAEAEAPGPTNPKAGRGAPKTSALYDQIRGGTFQLDQAQDLALQAYNSVKKLPTSVGEIRDDLLETLDALGEDLVKYSDTPSQADVDGKQAEWQKKKEAAIVFANDTNRDLVELKGALKDLLDDPKRKANTDAILEVDALLEEIIGTMVDAIQAMDGKVETVQEPGD